MGLVKRDLSLQSALALESTRAVNALGLGVQCDFAFAACSFSRSTLANGGGLTSALQCYMTLILPLCGL
jgi:hypothetical protein